MLNFKCCSSVCSLSVWRLRKSRPIIAKFWNVRVIFLSQIAHSVKSIIILYIGGTRLNWHFLKIDNLCFKSSKIIWSYIQLLVRISSECLKMKRKIYKLSRVTRLFLQSVRSIRQRKRISHIDWRRNEKSLNFLIFPAFLFTIWWVQSYNTTLTWEIKMSKRYLWLKMRINSINIWVFIFCPFLLFDKNEVQMYVEHSTIDVEAFFMV